MPWLNYGIVVDDTKEGINTSVDQTSFPVKIILKRDGFRNFKVIMQNFLNSRNIPAQFLSKPNITFYSNDTYKQIFSTFNNKEHIV